jgi:hypothetical protein
VSAAFTHVDPAVRISRGVWLPAAAAAEPIARLAALLTALPSGSALSGRTAAALHSMWVREGTEVDVTVPAGSGGPERTTGPRRRGVRAHRRSLAAGEVVLVAGLPVTSPARTWYDLAAELSVADLVAAGDSAVRVGLLTPAELARGLASRRGLRGTARARRSIPLLDAASRSRPESHLRVALALAGLPRPAVNAAVHDAAGQWLAEPDLSYAAARLAIEYQGSDHAGVQRMRKDVARHMDLRRSGWEVLYYTAEQVFTHPHVLVDDVRVVLARRCPELLAAAATAWTGARTGQSGRRVSSSAAG